MKLTLARRESGFGTAEAVLAIIAILIGVIIIAWKPGPVPPPAKTNAPPAGLLAPLADNCTNAPPP